MNNNTDQPNGSTSELEVSEMLRQAWESTLTDFFEDMSPNPGTTERIRRGRWIVMDPHPHGKPHYRMFEWDGRVVFAGWLDRLRHRVVIEKEKQP